MKRSRAAFTLVEIVLAIAIALLIMAVAVPAISNAFGDTGLEQTFRDFDEFVRTTQTKAMTERRDYVLIWQKDGILAEPVVPSDSDEEAEVDLFPAGKAKITLHRLVALDKKPLGEWPIWRSGTVEPVKIDYDGELGTWSAEFEPLTGRGRLLKMDEK